MSLDVKPNSSEAGHQSATDRREATPAVGAKESFAETALRLGGKSADEASRTGKIDMADDQVEDMFAAQYQTSASPIHRAVWERKVPIEQFGFPSTPMDKSIEVAMQQSVALVNRRRHEGTLYNDERKISDETLQELGKAGYWGMLIPREYEGLGSSFRDFARMLTRMACADPTVAGLASVHGCIGAVDPVRTFGNSEQKQRFLPSLADGSRLSGFALTEPAEKTFVTMLVGNNRKGLAFGWFNFAIGVAALPSSLIFGWLYQQFGPFAAFGWGASLSFTAMICLAFIKVPRQTEGS